MGVVGLRAFLKYAQGETLSESEIVAAKRARDTDVKVTPQIAFAQFGNRKSEPVIPALTQLLNAVNGTVDRFASEV